MWLKKKEITNEGPIVVGTIRWVRVRRRRRWREIGWSESSSSVRQRIGQTIVAGRCARCRWPVRWSSDGHFSSCCRRLVPVRLTLSCPCTTATTRRGVLQSNWNVAADRLPHADTAAATSCRPLYVRYLSKINISYLIQTSTIPINAIKPRQHFAFISPQSSSSIQFWPMFFFFHNFSFFLRLFLVTEKQK